MPNGRLIIDADSHVEEVEETWSFLEPPYSERPPLVLERQGGQGLTVQDAFWLIDGRSVPGMMGRGATIFGTPVTSTLGRMKPFSIESQTLCPPSARVADLDRAGIDVQVIFPTIFLEPLSRDPRFQTALVRSYNTWMSGKCAQFPDRLKWGAVLPMHSPAEAAAEVRRAIELGAACGVCYGTAGETMLHDAQFDPVWAEASRSGLPIAIHTGWSHPGLTASGDQVYTSQIVGFTLPVFMAFFSFLGGGILARFPDLKVCFMEAGADWLPYMIQRMDQYYEVDGRMKWAALGPEKPSAYLKRGNVYFTCEGDEKLLPVVLEWLGDDYMMASADMPHMEARENSLEEISERTDLSAAQKEKILSANPSRFFRM